MKNLKSLIITTIATVMLLTTMPVFATQQDGQLEWNVRLSQMDIRIHPGDYPDRYYGNRYYREVSWWGPRHGRIKVGTAAFTTVTGIASAGITIVGIITGTAKHST